MNALDHAQPRLVVEAISPGLLPFKNVDGAVISGIPQQLPAVEASTLESPLNQVNPDVPPEAEFLLDRKFLKHCDCTLEIVRIDEELKFKLFRKMPAPHFVGKHVVDLVDFPTLASGYELFGLLALVEVELPVEPDLWPPLLREANHFLFNFEMPQSLFDKGKALESSIHYGEGFFQVDLPHHRQPDGDVLNKELTVGVANAGVLLVADGKVDDSNDVGLGGPALVDVHILNGRDRGDGVDLHLLSAEVVDPEVEVPVAVVFGPVLGTVVSGQGVVLGPFLSVSHEL